MSWLYSRALVVEYLEANFSDGELSAQSRSMLTRPAFWSHDKTMAVSLLSRFGMMCGRLTDDRGEALLTWYREAFLAKTSAGLEREQGSQARVADSGGKWRESFAKWNPDTSSWKTRRSLRVEDSTKSSVTFPQWGSMRNGECYPPKRSALLTFVNASGSQQRNNREMFPTPTAQDAANNGSQSQQARESLSLNAKIGGPLNPLWVEWLMGWPTGWTDFEPLAMDKFQQWLDSHGACSEKDSEQ